MSLVISGEIGDCISSFPTIRKLGYRNVFNINRKWTRPDWILRSKSVKRLAESQSYIDHFDDYNGDEIEIDLSTYRSGGQKFGDTIASRIARWAMVDVDLSTPWLEVGIDKRSVGRIVISRGPRWRGEYFPWREIVKRFYKEILFIGVDSEHKEFCKEYGDIERLIVRDMLDVAEAIKGSELFIGSQSAPMAICEGLKHPMVAECCLTACDTIYLRENAIHVVDGNLEFEACGKKLKVERIPLYSYFKYEINGDMFFDTQKDILYNICKVECVKRRLKIINREEFERDVVFMR